MSQSTLSALRTVLDADALSELVGREVRAAKLRIKPEVSLLVGLADRSTGRTAGWARLLWPVAASKTAKVRKNAERQGLQVLTRDLDGQIVFQAGPELTDPRLAAPLRRARQHGLLEDVDPQAVLRYNPSRRLVLMTPAGVLRIRVSRSRRPEEVHRAAGRVVPVPRLIDPGKLWDSGSYSLQERCGTTDLDKSPDRTDTHRAGAMLARLHASTPSLPADLRNKLTCAPVTAGGLIRIHARTLQPLDRELADRTKALVNVLPARLEGHPVFVHGDASPDQFLRDPAGGALWLTDFDRARLAPAATDLGSYLSVCSADAAADVLAGYAEAGGQVPDAHDLRAATALAELSRLTEPLRDAQPGWREAIASRLARFENGEGPQLP